VAVAVLVGVGIVRNATIVASAAADVAAGPLSVNNLTLCSVEPAPIPELIAGRITKVAHSTTPNATSTSVPHATPSRCPAVTGTTRHTKSQTPCSLSWC